MGNWSVGLQLPGGALVCRYKGITIRYVYSHEDGRNHKQTASIYLGEKRSKTKLCRIPTFDAGKMKEKDTKEPEKEVIQ